MADVGNESELDLARIRPGFQRPMLVPDLQIDGPLGARSSGIRLGVGTWKAPNLVQVWKLRSTLVDHYITTPSQLYFSIRNRRVKFYLPMRPGRR